MMDLDQLAADLFDLDLRVEPRLNGAPGASAPQADDSADCTNDGCTKSCLTCE
jgi:hypothetical protein